MLYKNTYNPELDVILVQSPFSDYCTAYTVEQYYALRFVNDHLHFNGRFQALLSHSQQYAAYMLCNGFGNLADATPSELEIIGWDWSHVRDTDCFQIVEVADFIAKEANWFGGSFDVLVTQLRNNYTSLLAQGVAVDLAELCG